MTHATVAEPRNISIHSCNTGDTIAVETTTSTYRLEVINPHTGECLVTHETRLPKPTRAQLVGPQDRHVDFSGADVHGKIMMGYGIRINVFGQNPINTNHVVCVKINNTTALH